MNIIMMSMEKRFLMEQLHLGLMWNCHLRQRVRMRR